ncbi:MAG: DUF4395 family protein [Chloroflexi bacterium]|nr:MAG: DUF4395 family protein [Chloroflexota bacterium]TMG38155.1 MAG: DUF4395 family protein [Chloroflexota bacterium]
MIARRADPYRDTDVIDSRAPRVNQTVVALLALATLFTGSPIFVALQAAQLWIGLTLGRRFCLSCLFYFEVLQPRIGEGPIEDSRPPRFANLVGAIFLTASTVAYVIGLAAVGAVLAGIVAALAALAAATGLCAGCEMYRVAARLRGIRPGPLARVDLADFGAAPRGEIVVQFTHPLCTDCRTLEDKLRSQGREVVTVDVAKRPELARKYGIALVPTAVAVAPGGIVTARIA